MGSEHNLLTPKKAMFIARVAFDKTKDDPEVARIQEKIESDEYRKIEKMYPAEAKIAAFAHWVMRHINGMEEEKYGTEEDDWTEGQEVASPAVVPEAGAEAETRGSVSQAAADEEDQEEVDNQAAAKKDKKAPKG